MKQYAVENIADWFLCQSASISPKKLQKLCYYAEAWAWALFNQGLVNDTQFEAWAHGPVAPSLYQKYKHLGWQSIPKVEKHLIEDADAIELLQSVWVTYGDKSGNELEALSHEEMPWRAARIRSGAEDGMKCSEPIAPQDMREYYLSIYNGG